MIYFCNIASNCVTYCQESTFITKFSWSFPGEVIQVCKSRKVVWRTKRSELTYNCFSQNTYTLWVKFTKQRYNSNTGSKFLVVMPQLLLNIFHSNHNWQGISFQIGKHYWNDNIFLLWLLCKSAETSRLH